MGCALLMGLDGALQSLPHGCAARSSLLKSASPQGHNRTIAKHCNKCTHRCLDVLLILGRAARFSAGPGQCCYRRQRQKNCWAHQIRRHALQQVRTPMAALLSLPWPASPRVIADPSPNSAANANLHALVCRALLDVARTPEGETRSSSGPGRRGYHRQRHRRSREQQILGELRPRSQQIHRQVITHAVA